LGAYHDRLDALRRLAKDRAATPAEKATARRFAKALADKIGKRPRRVRRKGAGAALPEPPGGEVAAPWIIWLQAALHKIAVAGKWVHAVWIVSLIGLVLISVFVAKPATPGGRHLPRADDGTLLAVAFAMIAVAGLLGFASWWLRTWCGERLRPALIFLTHHAPRSVIASGAGLSAYLEDRFEWPTLFAFATTLAVVFAICIP
jgi:hypothetical protein